MRKGLAGGGVGKVEKGSRGLGEESIRQNKITAMTSLSGQRKL